jgi:hypothetical protein
MSPGGGRGRLSGGEVPAQGLLAAASRSASGGNQAPKAENQDIIFCLMIPLGPPLLFPLLSPLRAQLRSEDRGHKRTERPAKYRLDGNGMATEIPQETPLAARQQLRREVNFGCPYPGCGSPYLTYHHFDPPRRVRLHHEPAGMIALCWLHHQSAESGAITVAQLREMQAQHISLGLPSRGGSLRHLHLKPPRVRGGTPRRRYVPVAVKW